MPNDLTAIAMAPAPCRTLLDRADRYVRRAEKVARNPALTQEEAVAALDHLAALEQKLAEVREAETRAVNRAMRSVRAAEAALQSARSEISEALLHAAPDAGQQTAYGLVPHGDCDQSAKDVRAVSACRAMLDLEALRPYFDERSISAAIDRRRTATGRTDLTGVTYARLPKSANLACAVI